MPHTTDPSALSQGGKRAFELGDYAAALEQFRSAAEGFATVGDPTSQAEQLNNVGVTLLELGRARRLWKQ